MENEKQMNNDLKENKIKKGIVITAKYIACFFILISTYMILLILVNKIPSSSMENNIKKSADILLEQGERYTIDLGYKEESIFSFTDALMLNMAYSVDSNHPIDSMLLSRKDYIPGITKIENSKTTVNIGTDKRFIDPKNGDVHHTEELYQFINEKDMEESFEYVRYWHGYMIWLRPLLTIFNITGLRIFLTIVLITLSLALIYLIYKKINLITAIIFLLGLLGSSVFIVGQSLSEVSVFLVTLISSIIVLLKKNTGKNIGIVFFTIGSITAFTDFLTAPLIAMLIPITIYFLLIQKEEKITIKEAIKKYVFLCTIWIIGYMATWVSKWVILDLIKHRDSFSQALQQVQVRTAGNNVVTYSKNLIKIWKFLSTNSIIVLWIIPLVIISVIGAIRYNKNKNNEKICIIPFIINTMAPFIWYFAVKNHTYIHPFLAYKSMMISIINSQIIIANLLKVYKYRFPK